MYSSQKFVCHLPVQPPPSAKTKQNKKLLTVLKNHYVLEAAAGYAKGRTQMVAAHCNFFFPLMTCRTGNPNSTIEKME